MKDAYYFPHYTNARRDNKIRRIIKHLGVEGYGIFFMLLEVLREQSDFKYPMQDIDLLADEFGTSEEKVKVVITAYDLFVIDEDNKFFSPKLLLYLKPYFEKSERARAAALKRWNDANALPEHSGGTASKVHELHEANEGNESKEAKIEKLYRAYPRKVGVKKAKEKIAIALRKNDFEFLYDKVCKYAKAVSKEDMQFVPYPATWFHQERYNDDEKEWHKPKSNGTPQEPLPQYLTNQL